VILDGVVFNVGPLRISSTEPVRPLLAGGLALVIYLWRSSRQDLEADAAWLTAWFTRLVKAAAPAVVLLGCAVGLIYGSFTAGGADSYGYVSQAMLWLHGDLRIEQSIVQQVSWPFAAWTFTPLGYRPVSDAVIVPTYPPGLPMLMALFSAVFGQRGPFLVVPVLASVALACTYVLGKIATGSTKVGAFAALLLLASPPFLGHAMVPMTDVPVTAGWAVVCVLALAAPSARPLLAGLAAGATLLVRPNLVLLAAGPVIAWILGSGWAWRSVARNIALYAAGIVPAVIALLAVNVALYGAPLETGYGSFSDIYGLGAAPRNLRNYVSWMLETQSPMVLMGLIPIFAPYAIGRRTVLGCLLAMLVLTFASYLFYHPFENWTYLRFLLPAYPAVFVFMAATVWIICLRLPRPARVGVAVLLAATALSLSVRFARDQYVFNWRTQEQRYARAAARTAELTPPAAVLFSSQHSGSLRYYTDRLTLRYDLLGERRLDSAIRELDEKGRRSFLVIDEWEHVQFRDRFARRNRAGALDWPPLARVPGPPDVLIYDLGSLTQ
jgi:hypothetical protein